MRNINEDTCHKGKLKPKMNRERKELAALTLQSIALNYSEHKGPALTAKSNAQSIKST